MKNSQLEVLEQYYQQVSEIILARQNPITGLLPASTAITAHGDYTDAWVRDNVYSIMAAWGLGLAYRKIDDTQGRAALLDQSTVKLMRGLLIAMMKQAPKVEAFKHTQDPLDALHAKYATHTGDPVVGDDEWGHLQLDATSLFLLMLAQMTASGLRIVYTMDEVHFVQNLVHYIGRAYRTPDYGIWERGNKINHGIAEVNSSSVGMAKAALEAMDGFNCFGSEGGEETIIHVVPDEIARARITLESALPSESLSKELDAATLSVIGFPAFAVEDELLVELTLNEVVDKLAGNYGCKRFLRDGHQAANEDPDRLHYEPEEMKQFENIECEWPLFFTYLLLHYLFRDQPAQAKLYREKLQGLLVEQNGQKLLPELYRVPLDKIPAERENPGSQTREPNENVPLVWAQSLYVLGCLLQDGLLEAADIDPLGRHSYIGRNLGKQIQFSLISENENVQAKLHEYGLVTKTLAQKKPIQIMQANVLADAFQWLGRSDRLGLTGRPLRNLRGLATACVYEYQGQQYIFQPQFLNRQDFYFTEDNRMLVRRLKMEMGYIYRQWNLPGRPLVAMVVTESHLSKGGSEALIEFMEECRQGHFGEIPIRLGPLKSFLPTCAKRSLNYLESVPSSEEQSIHSAGELVLKPEDHSNEALLDINDCQEWHDNAVLAQLIHSSNLQNQLNLLQVLFVRHGGDYQTSLQDKNGQAVSVKDLIEEIYLYAGEKSNWQVMRLAAAILEKFDINLEGALTELLVRKIALSVSRQYSKHSTIRQPTGTAEILSIIKEFNADDLRAQILTQELILNLGVVVRSRPELLSKMTLIRTGQLLQLLAGHIRYGQQDCTADDALDTLMAKAPHEIAEALEYVFEHYADVQEELYHQELMSFDNEDDDLSLPHFEQEMNPDLGEASNWHHWRQINGSIARYPDGFYEGVWDIVNQSAGLVIGDQWNPKRRLDHALCANMTRGEKLFQDQVDHILNKTPVAEVRRLYYEALMVLGMVMQRNPEMRTEDSMFLDVLLGHAVRLQWLSQVGNEAIAYDGQRQQAWQSFYYSPPHEVANALIQAFKFLHK